MHLLAQTPVNFLLVWWALRPGIIYYKIFELFPILTYLKKVAPMAYYECSDKLGFLLSYIVTLLYLHFYSPYLPLLIKINCLLSAPSVRYNNVGFCITSLKNLYCLVNFSLCILLLYYTFADQENLIIICTLSQVQIIMLDYALYLLYH